jgi:hypothetical protein
MAARGSNLIRLPLFIVLLSTDVAARGYGGASAGRLVQLGRGRESLGGGRETGGVCGRRAGVL